MCDLNSLTKGQAAIVALTRAMVDRTGNRPPMPGILPDYGVSRLRKYDTGNLSHRCLPSPPLTRSICCDALARHDALRLGSIRSHTLNTSLEPASVANMSGWATCCLLSQPDQPQLRSC
jgi:hypothetical protein